MVEGLGDDGGCGAVAGKLRLEGFNGGGFCSDDSVGENKQCGDRETGNILTAMWRRLRDPLVRYQ